MPQTPLYSAIFFGTYFGASLTLQQTICVFVIYLAMTSMACFNIASDLAMFTGSVILLATEVITRDQFLQGEAQEQRSDELGVHYLLLLYGPIYGRNESP